eukprot:c8636_g1_i1 orf=1-207(-)
MVTTLYHVVNYTNQQQVQRGLTVVLSQKISSCYLVNVNDVWFAKAFWHGKLKSQSAWPAFPPAHLRNKS